MAEPVRGDNNLREAVEFVLRVGIVKDSEVSMPYGTELTSDRWNLFLLRVAEFDGILSQFLKEVENVREGIQVSVYDKGGHEFLMMLKKWETAGNAFYSLSRGWLSFLDQQSFSENHFISMRVFRHAFTDKLSFLVTSTQTIN